MNNAPTFDELAARVSTLAADADWSADELRAALKEDGVDADKLVKEAKATITNQDEYIAELQAQVDKLTRTVAAIREQALADRDEQIEKLVVAEVKISNLSDERNALMTHVARIEQELVNVKEHVGCLQNSCMDLTARSEQANAKLAEAEREGTIWHEDSYKSLARMEAAEDRAETMERARDEAERKLTAIQALEPGQAYEYGACLKVVPYDLLMKALASSGGEAKSDAEQYAEMVIGILESAPATADSSGGAEKEGT
jgi:chromosome segregation ATPase